MIINLNEILFREHGGKDLIPIKFTMPAAESWNNGKKWIQIGTTSLVGCGSQKPPYAMKNIIDLMEIVPLIGIVWNNSFNY